MSEIQNIEINLLSKLLDKQNYLVVKNYLSKELFSEELHDLYELIVEGYETHPTLERLDIEGLSALNKIKDPYQSLSKLRLFENILFELNDNTLKTESNSLANAELLISYVRSLNHQLLGQQIASLGMSFAKGSKDAIDEVTDLINKYNNLEDFLDEFGEETTQDIDKLLEESSNKYRLQFNLESLSRNVYGIGRGEFGAIFALPETGKSAFALYLCFGENGFAQQGNKVLYLGNEERTSRMMLRAISCYTGLNRDELELNVEEAREKFNEISENVIMKDIQDWTLPKIEKYINKIEPAVVVLDQGDKVTVHGQYSASHERLRELFKSLRELAKRTNVALLTVSQASADARGRTRLTAMDMEGSKIGKSAETDLIIGIAKAVNDNEDVEEDTTRFLTVSKNKISGWHGTIVANINPDLSQYGV